jgi:hypothetical protein
MAWNRVFSQTISDIVGTWVVFPPGGHLVPSLASRMRVRAAPVPPDFGPPYERRDGYTIGLEAELDNGLIISTVWSSFGSDGYVANLPDGTTVQDPPPTLGFPVSPGLRVRARVISDAIPSVVGGIEWQ